MPFDPSRAFAIRQLSRRSPKIGCIQNKVGHYPLSKHVHSDYVPPKSWDQFEELCADLFSAEWSDTALVRHGRAGQRQQGVDIVARQQAKYPIGLQCKKKTKWPVQRLTTADIDKEVTGALMFRPKLKSFYILTSAPDDAKLQKHARVISQRHARSKLFDVHVLGWGELCRRIALYSNVADKHYGTTGGQIAPLLATWFASNGRLEITGNELTLACRELRHQFKDYPDGRLLLKQRESDALVLKINAYEGKTMNEEQRGDRLDLLDELSRADSLESKIARGVRLMLADSSVTTLLFEVYGDTGDAPRAVAGFVNKELDPKRGIVKSGTTRLRVFAPGNDKIRMSSYINGAQAQTILDLMEERRIRYGKPLTDTVDELPPEVRADVAIPAVISSILRLMDKRKDVEQLREHGFFEIGQWRVGLG